MINTDCKECREIVDEFTGQAVTVSTCPDADRTAVPVAANESGLVFTCDGTTATLPIPGEHNAVNAALAATAAELLGVEMEQALAALAGVTVPGMRMEREVIGDVLLINDAYNSNFESLKAALAWVHSLSGRDRKILVCGDMLELGKATETLHRAIGWHVGRSSVNILITIGKNAALIGKEAHRAGTGVVYERKTVGEVADLLENIVRDGDAVLFKASRGVRLEQAVERLRSHLAKEPLTVTS